MPDRADAALPEHAEAGGDTTRRFSIAGLTLRLIPTLTIGLILLGVALRVRGYLTSPISLWEDEATWAVRFLEGRMLWNSIRPPGFIAACKVLVFLFGPNEAGLRALPWLAGLGTLVMAPLLANRLWTTAAARLLFVAVIALHPCAIDLAKEFKPYSVSLAFHMALLLLALSYTQSRTTAALAGLMGVSFVSSLFAQDCVFVYPAVFGVALLKAASARHSRHFMLIAGTAVLTIALLAAQFFLLWRADLGGRHADETAADYWGQKYDVFYTGSTTAQGSRLHWVTQKLGETVAMPGMRRMLWDSTQLSTHQLGELRDVDARVWLLLGCAGLAVLALRRRHEALVLLTLPIAVWLICNRLGLWPFGAFRTNLFALLYSAGLAASAFDLAGAKHRLWDLMPMSVLVLAPFLLLSQDFGTRKSSAFALNSSFSEAMQALAKLHGDDRRRREYRLILDHASCMPWRYYTRHHTGSQQVVRQVADLKERCAKELPDLLSDVHKALRRRGARVYVIVSRAFEIEQLTNNLPSDVAVDARVLVGVREQLVLRLKRKR